MEKWNSEKNTFFRFARSAGDRTGLKKFVPSPVLRETALCRQEGKRGRDKGAACATALSLRSSPAGQLLRAAPSNVCHQEPR